MPSPNVRKNVLNSTKQILCIHTRTHAHLARDVLVEEDVALQAARRADQLGVRVPLAAVAEYELSLLQTGLAGVPPLQRHMLHEVGQAGRVLIQKLNLVVVLCYVL